MNTWQGAGALGHLAMVLSGVVNAGYFAARACASHGAARVAAVVLGLLFLGVGWRGLAPLLEGTATVASLIHAAPLLAGTLLATLLVVLGEQR